MFFMRASAREPLEHRLTSRVRASQAGTGAIDVSDLALLLRASSVSCSPAEVLIVAISIDRDGSGSIDWAEYRDWLKADPHRFQRLHRRHNQLARARTRALAVLPSVFVGTRSVDDARRSMLNAARKHARETLDEALKRERERTEATEATARAMRAGRASRDLAERERASAAVAAVAADAEGPVLHEVRPSRALARLAQSEARAEAEIEVYLRTRAGGRALHRERLRVRAEVRESRPPSSHAPCMPI